MKGKLIYLILMCMMLIPLVQATYFEIYEFKPDNCEIIDSEKIECTYKLLSNKSNLYFIETDERIEDRIRAKPFMYEVGALIWPSKPTAGAYIFVGFMILISYLVIRYKDRL